MTDCRAKACLCLALKSVEKDCLFHTLILMPCVLIVAAEEGAYADVAKDTALTLTLAAACLAGCKDSVGKTGERQGLEPYGSGACKCGKGKALTAEKGVFKVPHELNIVINRVCKGNKAACVKL